MSRPGQVGPWPDGPGSAPREIGCTAPGPEHAFPSGRAAILACLRLAGIGPETVVATPECVTGCLADAVRRLARPVSYQAALEHLGAERRAAIVYEQWGWPLPPDAADAVRARLAGWTVVVDRVDSADFLASPRTHGQFEVVSLSKVLGLDAGGLARRHSDSALLRFAPEVNARPAPGADRPRLLAHPAVRELFKQSDHVHPSVSTWLAENCASTALEAERQTRQAAVRVILDSELSAGWPGWMSQAIESGAGPVWVPVLRGCAAPAHWRAIATLARSCGIAAAVRIFNWSGNPLAPCYEPSVALPVHSGLSSMAQIVPALRAR